MFVGSFSSASTAFFHIIKCLQIMKQTDCFFLCPIRYQLWTEFWRSETSTSGLSVLDLWYVPPVVLHSSDLTPGISLCSVIGGIGAAEMCSPRREEGTSHSCGYSLCPASQVFFLRERCVVTNRESVQMSSSRPLTAPADRGAGKHRDRQSDDAAEPVSWS